MDRLVWRSVLPRADDEKVGVVEHAAQVEHDDVDRLLVVGVVRRSCGRAPPSSCVEPPLLDVVGDCLSGTRWRIGRPARAVVADLRRRDVDPGHVEEHGPLASRQRPQPIADLHPAACPAARRPRARRAPRSPPAPPRSAGSAAMSPPTIKVSSSPGRLAWISLRVVIVYDGPGRRELEVATRRARRPPPRPAGTSPAGARTPGSAWISLCGGAGRPPSARPGRARAGARPLGAGEVAGAAG